MPAVLFVRRETRARLRRVRGRQGETMIKIKLVRSWIGCTPKQRAILLALGLKKLHMEKEFKDTPAIRGMVAKVPHMVEVLN